MVLASGDRWGSEVYPRTEITPRLTPRMAYGTRYRFASGFWFPTGSVFPEHDVAGCGDAGRPNEMVGPFQLHGSDDFPPILASQLFEGEMRLAYLTSDRGTPEFFTIDRPPPTGRYVAFQIDYQPSGGDDGYARVTIDGEVVLERSGSNHTDGRAPTDGGTGGFFEQSLYDYWCTVRSELVVYLDDLHIYRY